METQVPDKYDIIQASSLFGRSALVTGAGGHIGPFAVKVLEELGAYVYTTDHKDCPQYAHHLNHDLSMRLDVEDLCKELPANLKILVHCAAMTGTGEGIRRGWAVNPEDQTIEAFELSVKVQAYSLFQMQHHLTQLENIVVLGSIYGQVAPNMALYKNREYSSPFGYTFTKWGLRGLVKHLAVVKAPACRVNTLVPGGILRGQEPDFIKAYEDLSPMGRMSTEEDLMGAFAFMCSDMSRYMTGTELVVDGGWTAW